MPICSGMEPRNMGFLDKSLQKRIAELKSLSFIKAGSIVAIHSYRVTHDLL